jgi:hypothetical protein
MYGEVVVFELADVDDECVCQLVEFLGWELVGLDGGKDMPEERLVVDTYCRDGHHKLDEFGGFRLTLGDVQFKSLSEKISLLVSSRFNTSMDVLTLIPRALSRDSDRKYVK